MDAEPIERSPRDGTGQSASEEVIFAPIGSGNVYEETVERLAGAIKLGVVAPGERLPPERELAPRLGVSRVTLREANRALEQAGYLERRRGRSGGSFVTYRPRNTASLEKAKRMAKKMGENLLDALAFRRVVEPGAAGLAAERASDGKSSGDLSGLAAMAAEAAPKDYRGADSRLHLAIASMAGCPPLARAVADVQMRLTDLLSAIPLLEPAIEHANQQHAAIIGAIVDGDVELARKEMETHVDATANLIRGFLS